MLPFLYISTGRPKKKFKAAFPAGVVKDWRNKITTLGVAKNEGASKKAAGVAIGGLGEDDLDDVRPMGTGRSKNVCMFSAASDATNPSLDH